PLTATETVTETEAPSDTPTVPPTTVSTATPVAVATPGQKSSSIAVQLDDNTVALIDATGKVTPLGKAPVQLSGSPFASTLANGTVYAMSVGLPPGAFAFDKSGMRPLDFMGTNVTGLAAWPGQTPQDTL